MCGNPRYLAEDAMVEDGLEPFHPQMPGTTTLGDLAELLLEDGYDEIPRALHSLTLSQLYVLIEDSYS